MPQKIKIASTIFAPFSKISFTYIMTRTQIKKKFVAPAVQFTASAMLFLLIVGNYKVRLCMVSKKRKNRAIPVTGRGGAWVCETSRLQPFL
jgi:hypothetical protein